MKSIEISQAFLLCHMNSRIKEVESGWMLSSPDPGQFLGILGGEASKRVISIPLAGSPGQGEVMEAHLVFFPGEDEESVENYLEQEAHPLPDEAFTVSNGLFLGYDPAKGYYEIQNVYGQSADWFTSFFRNPNMYLSTGLDITNDDLKRKIYIQHHSGAGALECAILTDTTGFPLPVAVESAKNFGMEKEEPDDTPFSESYFPVQLEASERLSFNVLHLHQNWGDHALRQVSSIRFFQIYYHLSQGVTETTCFSLPTKFGSVPSGEPRAYTLADYRPLSGQMWAGSPQHHHVALEGWLQYLDAAGNWRYPVYKGSEIYSAGPNLAWFTLNYVSSDGKVDQHLEIFEMPQEDESRTHIRLRYTFNEDVEIGGEVVKNLRLINKGSYIRKLNWKELAWTAPDGEIRTHPMETDGKWDITGEELKPYNSFFSAYPHADGNAGLVIRKVSGNVNGSFFDRVGYSAIGHEDGKAELMLVPLIEGNIIKKGSVMEIDCILIPYGDDRSSWTTPYEESVRYGLNSSELEAYLDASGKANKQEPVFGPSLEALHGEVIQNLPPMVKARDNFASVKFSGAHQRISLVATGFSHSKYPMLWEGKAWLDPQVKGHDGIQAFENQDGSYGFVFTPLVRTSRVSGKWGTSTHVFHVTQAISASGIRELSSLNGRVKIEQYEAGHIELVSPRFWYPARHEVLGERLSKMESGEKVIETAPISVSGEALPQMIEIVAYSPDRVLLKTSSKDSFTLDVEGLYPNEVYVFTAGEVSRNYTSDRHGILKVEILNQGNETETEILIKSSRP